MDHRLGAYAVSIEDKHITVKAPLWTFSLSMLLVRLIVLFLFRLRTLGLSGPHLLLLLYGLIRLVPGFLLLTWLLRIGMLWIVTSI